MLFCYRQTVGLIREERGQISMRIVKEAAERKNEILDAAAVLFASKGFDNTSANDILDAVGIARGTLYHHFKSKEDVMDALIERQTQRLLSAARQVAEDNSIPVEQRIVQTITALRIDEKDVAMTEHLHKPQNALMHLKINQILMRQLPPILAGILEDGIEQGLFDTPYPEACMELAIIYLKTVFDDGVFELTSSQSAERMEAFTFHLERMLGVAQGRLSFLTKLIKEGADNESIEKPM